MILLVFKRHTLQTRPRPGPGSSEKADKEPLEKTDTTPKFTV